MPVRRIVETPPGREAGRARHPETNKAGANGSVCSCQLFYAGIKGFMRFLASYEIAILMEPLNQSAAALSGSFAPTYRFENLEIHKSIPAISKSQFGTKSLADHSCDLIRASLKK